MVQQIEDQNETNQSEAFIEERKFDVETNGEQPNLQQAGKEWEELTQQFTSLVLNEAGMQHADDGHFADAVIMWNKATSLGCAQSHYNLAVCYENGKGCKKDLEEVRA